jgi:hypothetical protein
MKRLTMIGTIAFGCVVVCVAVGTASHYSTLPPATKNQVSQALEQALPAQGQVPTPPPPSLPSPPPSTAGMAAVRSLPDPPRTLVGIDRQQLRQVESYLPEGSTIRTFPIDESQETAALATGDLNSDGTQETIVGFNTPEKTDGGMGTLFLGVLAGTRDKMTLQSSVRLHGDYIYNNIYEPIAVPFAVRDVTGDGIPEILVTSSQGASLGAHLEVFSFYGQSLHPIASVAGDVIRLIDRGAGRSAAIKAQWKGNSKEQLFEWKGGKFEEVR